MPGGGGGPIQLPPGFGNMRQFKTGTGRIRGRVVATDNGNPVRRATVSITSSDIATKAAVTDADGRFEFRDLLASKFMIQVSKPGYMAVQYGQTRPFESGKPIELAEKQFVDNIIVAIPKGGAITGRIVDEYGDPMPDVAVTAMRQAWVNGRRRLTPVGNRSAQTNDLGQFRIYGLAPGEYFVSATAATQGGFLELPTLPGDFDTTVIRAGVAGPGPSASVPKSGYAPTYFPGTPNAADAQKVTLGTGQETAGVDFGLVAVRMARVSGLVVNSEGRPFEGAAISLVPAVRDGNTFVALPSTRAAKDGSFTLNSVPPGDYMMRASALQVITSSQGDGMTMAFRSATMIGGADQESGSAALSVGGEDIANVMIIAVKGGTATGRVTFDGPKPATMNLRVSSAPVDGDAPLTALGGARVKEDGTFELKGLSGQRLIRVTAPTGWIVRAVKLNGTDITDTGAEFKPGETTSGLEIELTSKSTSVTGTVTTSEGSIIKDYTFVVFAETSELWRLPMTRWVAGGRPDQDGRFKIQNLPAGRYYAAAVEYLPQGEWNDPDLLDRLKSQAKRFSLDEGGTQTLDLKLTTKY
jgi:hypothetical protein